MSNVFAVSRTSLLSTTAALWVWSTAACDPPPDRESAPAAGSSTARRDQSAPRALPSPPGGAVSHRLSFADARNHYVGVESSFPTGGRASIDLMMAVWTPGSYVVREYSRHVEALEAFAPDGARLPAVKTRKNRWRIGGGNAKRVTVRYRLYAPELTPRTSWVSGDMAVLVGAATFLAPVGELGRPQELALELPPAWEESVTALPPHPGGQRHRYLAADYDALVDAPILLGNPVVRRFEVGGVRHRLATAGDTGMWEPDRAARDVARLVEAQRAFWRQLPYRSFDFLIVLADDVDTGGLEHRDSTLLVSSPWSMRRRKDHAAWLGVVSHELFHAWNVKRLRPAELGPFDYEGEVYTESLWLVEGVTAYYADLLALRAGLIDRPQYLAALSEHIREVESAPGREVQSIAASSVDAWIEYYRQDENSANSTVDYYEKGALLGFLLDAEIRRATAGKRSLDDVMRLAYSRHAGARGYRPEDVRRIAEEIAGADLGRFWRDFVQGVAPLDYRPALDYYGLRFERADDGAPDGEEAQEEADGGEPPGHLGLDTREDGGRLVVAKLVRDGPAWRAGVQAGDEILAVDDRRVPRAGLSAVLPRYRPGARVTLLVSRLGALRRLPVTLDRAPAEELDLAVAPGASAAQRARLAAWLAVGP